MIDTGLALSTAVYGGTAGVGLGLALAFVRWLAVFIAGRQDQKEAHLDAGTARLIAGLERRIAEMTEREGLRERHLAEREAAWDRWREEVEQELADCRRRDAEKDGEIMRLRAILQGYGDAKQLAQLQIAADKVNGDDRP